MLRRYLGDSAASNGFPPFPKRTGNEKKMCVYHVNSVNILCQLSDFFRSQADATAFYKFHGQTFLPGVVATNACMHARACTIVYCTAFQPDRKSTPVSMFPAAFKRLR